MNSLKSSRVPGMVYDDKDIIFFPKGIPGFEHLLNWLIVGDRPSSVVWLHSVDEDVAVPIAHPKTFFPDYDAHIPKSVLSDLKADSSDDLNIAVVLSISKDDPKLSTANLRAPILINPLAMLGMQVIAMNDDYGVQHPLFPDVYRVSGGL